MSNVPAGEFTQEYRFAVVMYGGVSLAIYINGVTQELLSLVRATAPTGPDYGSPCLAEEAIGSTAKVYRKIGQMLSRDPRDRKTKAEVEADPGRSIRTRFMIDIISGTSAGGINGIFLAKALARGQSLDKLKELWVGEGDILKLIQDQKSEIFVQDPPPSLLNSRRMYSKLLDAFDGMDDSPLSEAVYAEEIDLFTTTTDIRGVPVPLRLADMVIFERRYRNVFRFHYERGLRDHDFTDGNNPFLAFAARCTSSFPFAFEPMQLRDIDAVLASKPKYRADQGTRSESLRWAPFFESYQLEQGREEKIHFVDRSYGDGGYLDNKPFSYAIDALFQRQSTLPVDRKLLYIEPSPEPVERVEPLEKDRPNAFENTTAAALSLPRSETIREDLRRIIDRNRLVERMSRILEESEQDNAERAVPEAGDKWAANDLREMIERYGIAYGAYHRLKVANVTDDLADLIALAAGFDEKSDYHLAISYLVNAWRERNYDVYSSPNDDPENRKPTLNRFLLDFDLTYRTRRLEFVRSKLDRLACLDANAWAILGHKNVSTDYLKGDKGRALVERLRSIKRELNLAYSRLMEVRRTLWARSEKSEIRGFVLNLDIQTFELDELLAQPTDRARQRFARRKMTQGLLQTRLDILAGEISSRLQQAMIQASSLCKAAVEPASAQGDPIEDVVREALWRFYRHFDDYDMRSYPVTYAAQAGELDSVEVIRVSPEDATSVIDERNDPLGRRKLAGTVLGNFGAFLDPAWRRNDILWGRLDGAERIISALLPGKVNENDRKALIEEAHLAILEEELRLKESTEVKKLLMNVLLSLKTEEQQLAKIRSWLGEPTAPNLEVRHRLDHALQSCLDSKQAYRYFREVYEVDRTPSPQIVAEALSRSTQVVGRILEGIAGDQHNRRFAWVTRLGQIFWGLVIVAVPGSVPNLIARHWMKLLYTFEALAIGLGLVFGADEVQTLGWEALVVTGLVHFSILGLGDYLWGRTGPTWRLLIRLILTILIAALLVSVLSAPLWGPEVLGRLILWLQKSQEFLQTMRSEMLEAIFSHWLRALAGIAIGGVVLVLSSVIGMRIVQPRPTLPGGFHQPLLALEFATPDNAPAVLNKIDTKKLEKSILGDYILIGIYWTVLIGLCLIYSIRFPGLAWLGIAAGAFATALAVADLIENHWALKLLTDSTALGAMSSAGFWKWTFLFVTCVILGLLMVLAGGIGVGLGCLFLTAAVVGAVGIATRGPLVEAAFVLVVLALLLGVALFVFLPRLRPS